MNTKTMKNIKIKEFKKRISNEILKILFLHLQDLH